MPLSFILCWVVGCPQVVEASNVAKTRHLESPPGSRLWPVPDPPEAGSAGRSPVSPGTTRIVRLICVWSRIGLCRSSTCTCRGVATTTSLPPNTATKMVTELAENCIDSSGNRRFFVGERLARQTRQQPHSRHHRQPRRARHRNRKPRLSRDPRATLLPSVHHACCL